MQAGSIIYSQIYRADDAPRYVRGNTVLISICCLNIFLYCSTKVFYRTLNSRREKTWSKMSVEVSSVVRLDVTRALTMETSQEKSEYLATTKDEGNERLDFRFIH